MLTRRPRRVQAANLPVAKNKWVWSQPEIYLGLRPARFRAAIDMKLVVGLGNPGLEYQRTRHNAGFMLADTLVRLNKAERWRRAFSGWATDYLLDEQKVVVLKPETFMNLSGRSVRAAVDFYNLPVEDFLILVDDIALPNGKIRIRGGGSSGGHNGLTSVANVMRGSDGKISDFARLRIGIGPPGDMPLERYVLARFSPAEDVKLEEALTRGAEAVDCWIRSGTVAAMNKFNGD